MRQLPTMTTDFMRGDAYRAKKKDPREAQEDYEIDPNSHKNKAAYKILEYLQDHGTIRKEDVRKKFGFYITDAIKNRLGNLALVWEDDDELGLAE
jgi:hypothetical protein